MSRQRRYTAIWTPAGLHKDVATKADQTIGDLCVNFYAPRGFAREQWHEKIIAWDASKPRPGEMLTSSELVIVRQWP